MIKTQADIEKICAIIYRLEELEIPKQITKRLWAWVRREERKVDPTDQFLNSDSSEGKMKGILFKPDMIQAVIEDRKTQTRRLIKPQPDLGLPDFDRYSHIEVGRYHPTKVDKNGEQYPSDEIFGAYTEDGEWGWRCPFPVGETVYIKEAWRVMAVDDNCPICDLSPQDSCLVQYKDSSPSPTDCIMGKWRTPLFMPQWAARHFITITGVRAERLQEISIEDIKAEGIDIALPPLPYDPLDPQAIENKAILDEFILVWNSINPKYPWESNPWVFAYTFRSSHGPK